ncbi:MAG TPA: Rne/Rng family ribonuclease [Terracidiphilus sp.]|nr:Rne/Rng family ribonuclease [Terracidiphilus sp.]
MAKEICISSTPHETRLAILEDDQLAEIYYERENEYTLAGSIYNGRVTRVLPGMQSAFVDIGLERDAFLYVTDFLELEDQEESDELEKAAASGSSQPPREVRQTNGHERGQHRERHVELRPTGEGALESADAEFAPAGESAESAEQPSGEEEAGAKRWRGRRRRRGGRSGSNAATAPAESQEFIETHINEAAEPKPEVVAEIRAEAMPRAPKGERGPEKAAEAFVLPGESLSKYGGTPVETALKPAVGSPAVPRPASTFKPATLIEAPIVWDGSGLLPGESLSRRHHQEQQAAPVAAERAAVSIAAEPEAADAIEEQELVEETASTPAEHEQEFVEEATSAPAEQDAEQEVAASRDHLAVLPEDDMVEETYESHAMIGETVTASENEAIEPSFGAPATDDSMRQQESVVRHRRAEIGEQEETEHEGTEFEGDRSASHNVDPAPPAEFRLFGLGGKRKKASDEEPPEPPTEAPQPEQAPAHVAAVSSFSPGSGLVEEEIIEGEEFEAPRHQHKAEEHDLDDYEEEEKLHTQIRSGELGEMLQEAHLDHRIQLKFDDKNGTDAEEGLEEVEEEEEEAAAAESQPAGDGHAPQRRERGGRGRRGRDRGHRSGDRRGQSRRSAQTSDLPIISDLLKPGQEILVQIAKEPIAKKGARITSHIALPGRFLVFMPTVNHVGVSRKIASEEERHRLKRILTHERGDASGGFIVRTAAEGASEEELRADLRFLIHLWNEIKQRSDSSKSPALIYHDLSLIERILRDQVSSNFSSIWVDSEADYERIVRFLNRFSPSLVRRVKLYTKETPLFEHFGIQDEISKALRSKVWLKSGGSIVINQTEALVAIDINTGKYVGKTARLEDTILKTNLDAIPEIVRQIRLRDLGGIIVIDFIDMDERKNRFKVMAALEEALKNDRAPTKVLQFNDFGLVAITRKRVKQSLERTLSIPCPTCQATGMVKSSATVANEIYIELRKMKRHFEGSDVMLRVNPETVKVLKANGGNWITEFEELIGKNILIKSDPTLHPEQFDIQG